MSKNLETAQHQVYDINSWIEGVRSYLALDEADYDTIHSLVEKIEIYEAEDFGKNIGKL